MPLMCAKIKNKIKTYAGYYAKKRIESETKERKMFWKIKK